MNDAATWVQAGASVIGILVAIVGIVVAIYVPRTIARDAIKLAEQERSIKERNLSIRIQGEFMRVYKQIENLRDDCSKVLSGILQTTILTNPALLKIDVTTDFREILISSALDVPIETTTLLQTFVLEIDVYNGTNYSQRESEGMSRAKEQLDRCYKVGSALLNRLEKAAGGPAALED